MKQFLTLKRKLGIILVLCLIIIFSIDIDHIYPTRYLPPASERRAFDLIYIKNPRFRTLSKIISSEFTHVAILVDPHTVLDIWPRSIYPDWDDTNDTIYTQTCSLSDVHLVSIEKYLSYGYDYYYRKILIDIPLLPLIPSYIYKKYVYQKPTDIPGIILHALLPIESNRSHCSKNVGEILTYMLNITSPINTKYLTPSNMTRVLKIDDIYGNIFRLMI